LGFIFLFHSAGFVSIPAAFLICSIISFLAFADVGYQKGIGCLNESTVATYSTPGPVQKPRKIVLKAPTKIVI